MKSWYASKTLWINLLAIIALILQSQFGFILDPELQTAILGFINLILRIVTNSQLDWSTGPRPSDNAPPPVVPLLALIATAALISACAVPAAKPATNDSPQIVAGKSLLAAKSTIVTAASATDTLCRSGQMPADKCAQAKLAYKTSQHAYDAAVDAYLLHSTQGGDPAELTQALVRVHDIANHLLQLAGGVK